MRESPFSMWCNWMFFVYWTLLHDAVVYMYSKTEEGEEYLRNAWRLEQVEPDVGKLREKYGKKTKVVA